MPVPSIESDAEFVSYSYAPGVLGIDEPIEIHKGTETVIPHTGWRGMLAMGTYTDGTPSDCAVANPCTRIDWPAMNVTTDGAGYNRAEPSTWYGSIASSGTEGSGLQYMRNRYYDPKRGQFTQADPIGLAGGMNLYGFASGDPVNFGDPFGTCPPANTNVDDCPNDNLGNAWRALVAAGSSGTTVISGIVKAKLNVTQRSFLEGDACGERSCFRNETITLNRDDAPGVMAVELAHEYTHSTEPMPKSKWDAADNELSAWDESHKVYDNLKDEARRTARKQFDEAFRALRSPDGRRVNRAHFACMAGKKALGESTSSC